MDLGNFIESRDFVLWFNQELPENFSAAIQYSRFMYRLYGVSGAFHLYKFRSFGKLIKKKSFL